MTGDQDFSPNFHHERANPAPVCGIDEAGRGPWAGPVVAAAVHIAPWHEADWHGLTDSKKLSTPKREAWFARIQQHAQVGIGLASPMEIDEFNIWGATKLAMQRALNAMPITPTSALVDGKVNPSLSIPCTPLIKGDRISLSIAAASVIAKVTRDQLMQALALEYPAYGFDRHMGYGTAHHSAALKAHGPCPAHRTSFAPIRSLLRAMA